MPPSVSCGVCGACRRGHEHLCEDVHLVGYDIDGGLGRVHADPGDGDRAEAGARRSALRNPRSSRWPSRMACCLNGMDQYRVDVGDVVVILGAGPIGLIHLQLAMIAGARTVVVSDPSESRREGAAELGAGVTVDPTSEDLARGRRGLTDGRVRARGVVVCIGRPATGQRRPEPRGQAGPGVGLRRAWPTRAGPRSRPISSTTGRSPSSARRTRERPTTCGRSAARCASGRSSTPAAMVTHRFPREPGRRGDHLRWPAGLPGHSRASPSSRDK